MIGKNILLRAPEPADVDKIHKWENDTSLWHLGNTLAPFSRFSIEQFVLNNEADIFANRQLRLLIDWHSSSLQPITVGSIDLFDFDPHHLRAGIGILIDKEYRNKGFAYEALQLLISYCFDVLCLHQLYCNIEQSNHESIHLFQKAGFIQCGVKKDWLRINNEWKNELTFQLFNPK